MSANLGEMPVLSGMLFCADCGNKLYQVRGKDWRRDKEYFVFVNYHKQKSKCSSHQIRNIQIEAILPHELRMITSLAKRHKKEFVELTMKKSKKELT